MLLPVIGKLIQLMGLLLLVGVPLFWWWLWRPAQGEAGVQAASEPKVLDSEALASKVLESKGAARLKAGVAPAAPAGAGVSGGRAAPPWLWPAALVGALLALAGSGADLLRILGPLAGGLPLEQQLGFALSFLRQTAAGRAMLLRLPAAVAVLVALRILLHLSSRRAGPGLFRWLWLLTAAGLLATTPLSGHAVTSPTPLLTILADWLHLAAALLWGGSLVGLSLIPLKGEVVALSADYSVRAYTAALRRMSTLGMAAVMTLVGSGVLLAGLHIFGIEAVPHSLYGRSLAWKLALVSVLVAIAALNRFLWLPRLQQVAAAAAPVFWASLSRLRTAVRVEAAVLLMVFALTAVMTQTTPPATPGRLAGPHTWAAQAGPWSLQARMEPREGSWMALRLEIVDRESQAPARLDQVVVTLDMPGHTMALAPREAVRVEEGVYEATAPVVMAGPWEADVALVKDSTRARAVFPFDLQEAPLNARSPLQLILMGGWLGIVQLVAAMGTSAAGLWLIASWLGQRHRSSASSGLLSGALFLAGGLFWMLFMALVPTAYWPNPSQELALTGRLAEEARPLYEQHCAPCHGPAGRGDGPQAAGLRTRPADFAVHVTHHTEGEFFWMITHGLPGTDMPPFESVLTEEERWMLARYIQELGRTAVRQLRQR